jgi:mono/diheme cytochrome c family protein
VTVKTMRGAAAALLFPVLLTGCESWITDMVQQPSVGTWQQTSPDSTIPSRGMPQGSVPVTGVTVAAWEVSYSQMPQTVDSLRGVRNPVAADERSLENGRKLFQVNCAVCHGERGDADSPMRRLNPGYGFAPSLLTPLATGYPDGYIWGMMRNGRGLMPPQNRIPEQSRWDVVNYIRGLQGRYPVTTGPAGFPGQTGAALPGFTAIGPTVPSRHVKPTTAGTVPKAPGAARSGDHE